MEYRKYKDDIYVRMDRGDEIITKLLDICRAEKIESATFSGIGGCGSADIQTFIPEKGEFELRRIEGMLELASLTGNVITDEAGDYYCHSHAVFAYKENGKHRVAAGHIKSITVSYTAEIVLKPVFGGVIRRKYDAETGTGFWSFDLENGFSEKSDVKDPHDETQ